MALYTEVIFHLPRVNMHQKILTMWALAMLKDFRIAPCIRKIGMPKLLTLGMNNPVVDIFISNVTFFVLAISLPGDQQLFITLGQFLTLNLYFVCPIICRRSVNEL